MAGIVFPDFAGSLGAAMQIRSQAQRNALEAAREERILKQQDEEDKAQQYLPAALQGDKAAIANLPPRWAIQLMPMLEKLDTQQRQKVKDAYDWQGNTALGILSLPEAERQRALDAAHEEAKTLGYDLKNFPTQYTPGVAGLLQFHANRSVEGRKLIESIPQPMGPVGGAPMAAPGGAIGNAGNAIAGIESGNNYAALGPATGGDRAYGKYQVMGANVPTWTAEVLGKPMSPQEFLASPEAQDAVFKAKFGQYMQKYGPEGAARAWFAGEGGMNNPNAKDVLGTSVADYAARFNKGMGGPQVAQAGGFAPTNTPAQSVPGGGTPIMPAQGDAIAGQGDVMAPPRAPAADDMMMYVDNLRRKALTQGGDIFKDPKTGKAEVQDGHLIIRSLANPRQVLGYAPLPPKQEPQPKTLEERDRETLLNGDPNSAPYAAAYAHLGAPRITVDPTSGQMVTVQPDMTWARKPTFAGANAPQSAEPPASGAKTVTVTPGHGRPIPGTENETISKNVAAIGSIDKALDIMDNPTADAQPSGRVAGFLSRNLGQGGDQIAQEIDPAGVKARALLADINSQIMLARSGAAVTEGEAKRLIALLPSASDKPEVIVQKLNQVRSTYADILKGQASQYTKENGFIPHEGAQKIIGGGKTATQGYVGPDGSAVSMDEIQKTAKNRGITTDDVIRFLNLKPAGQ